ncbi:PEP-CTERM sorting domain-containing protein [Thauera sp.]|uniref:PEP-CTERM sorting domain-containing protein n=1 Tax=Thauera sp. TaxID=1905334 RepID=UPI002CF11528|nr:PEP-CTERM sorting domain-containing protein [Thauera sp.]HRP24617.1 PEP-CTERM sorting domain-containing protein [Thauera sp.]
MLNNKNIAALIATASLCVSGSALAAPIQQVLLSEDFQGVSGVTTASAVRTIANILANNPTELSGSPLATFSNTGNGNASQAAFNVRAGNNAIDGGTTPSTNTFDGYFGAAANRFLVIGDEGGNLGGAPNGGTNAAASSTMSLRFTLDAVTLALPKLLTISFDYVFDANNTANNDTFVAELVLADNSIINLLSFAAPSVTTRGTFDVSLAYPTFDAGYINFYLVEGSGNGSSAVGLDNIRVTAVPEPGALALLGIGLFGLGVLRRRG